MFLIIINVLHVSGGPSAHHQEPIKLYGWCGWLGTSSKPSTPAVDSRRAWQYPGLHIQFYRLLMMGGRSARNM